MRAIIALVVNVSEQSVWHIMAVIWWSFSSFRLFTCRGTFPSVLQCSNLVILHLCSFKYMYWYGYEESIIYDHMTYTAFLKSCLWLWLSASSNINSFPAASFTIWYQMSTSVANLYDLKVSYIYESGQCYCAALSGSSPYIWNFPMYLWVIFVSPGGARRQHKAIRGRYDQSIFQCASSSVPQCRVCILRPPAATDHGGCLQTIYKTIGKTRKKRKERKKKQNKQKWLLVY